MKYQRSTVKSPRASEGGTGLIHKKAESRANKPKHVYHTISQRHTTTIIIVSFHHTRALQYLSHQVRFTKENYQ